MKAAKSDEWVTALINRPAIGVEPATTWPALLQNSFLKVKPQGLNQVFTAMCGSCSNEIAFKAAFMTYQHKKRGGYTNITMTSLTILGNHSPKKNYTHV